MSAPGPARWTGSIDLHEGSMLDQKEIVQRIYLDLVNDPDWITRYLRDPRQVLRSYGIRPENEARLLHILSLFSP